MDIKPCCGFWHNDSWGKDMLPGNGYTLNRYDLCGECLEYFTTKYGHYDREVLLKEPEGQEVLKSLKKQRRQTYLNEKDCKHHVEYHNICGEDKPDPNAAQWKMSDVQDLLEVPALPEYALIAKELNKLTQDLLSQRVEYSLTDPVNKMIHKWSTGDPEIKIIPFGVSAGELGRAATPKGTQLAGRDRLIFDLSISGDKKTEQAISIIVCCDRKEVRGAILKMSEILKKKFD